MKKFLAMGIAVLSVGLLVGCGTKNVPEVTVQIQQGADPADQVNALQSTLAQLFVDYRTAQLATNALLLIDPTVTPLSGFQDLAQKTIAQWKLVSQDAEALGKLIPPQTSRLIPAAYAQEPQLILADESKFNEPLLFPDLNQKTMDDMANSAKNLDAMYMPKDFKDGESSEVQLVPTKREQIEAIKAKFPNTKILQLVQSAFGGTARDAQKLVEEHYQAETANYNDSDAFYAKAAYTAQAISTASKVALFIGGAVITAGWSAVATMGVAPALSTAFGSSLTARGGTTIAIGGVSTVCAVAEDGVALGFTSAETAASFKAMSDKLWPINTVLGLVDIKDGLGNPGNLVTVYERGKYGLDKAGDFLNMDIQGDQIKVNSKSTKYPELNEDGMLKQLPVGYGYRAVYTSNGEQVYTDEGNTQTNNSEKGFFGSYTAKITAMYAFNGQNYPMTVDGHIVISKDGKVKFTLADNGSFSYGVEGMQMTAKYIIKGEMNGTIDKDGKMDVSGNFNSSVNVDLPAEVMNAMPPEYKSRLNGGAQGPCNAQGQRADNALQGTVAFSANGMNSKGTFETVAE